MKKSVIILSFLIVSLIVFPVSSQRTYFEVKKEVTPNRIPISSIDKPIHINIKISVPKRIKMDVVFSIDSSESMKENDPKNLRIYCVKNFIEEMQPSNGRVGLVSWDHDVDFSVPLTSNFSKIISRLRDINSEGGTNLNVGLRGAIDLLNLDQREGAIKVIIFLTDGVGDYTSPNDPTSPISAAIRNNYIVYTIGLGDKIDESILTEIADVTGGRYIHAKDAESLISVFEEIRNDIAKIAPPKKVRLVEVLPEYIDLIDNFTKTPSNPPSMIDGFTRIEWDIGDMKIGETWEVSFNVTLNSSKIPMDAYQCEGSRVIYEDYDGRTREVFLPKKMIALEESTKIDLISKVFSKPMNMVVIGGCLGTLSVLAYYILKKRRV